MDDDGKKINKFKRVGQTVIAANKISKSQSKPEPTIERIEIFLNTNISSNKDDEISQVLTRDIIDMPFLTSEEHSTLHEYPFFTDNYLLSNSIIDMTMKEKVFFFFNNNRNWFKNYAFSGKNRGKYWESYIQTNNKTEEKADKEVRIEVIKTNLFILLRSLFSTYSSTDALSDAVESSFSKFIKGETSINYDLTYYLPFYSNFKRQHIFKLPYSSTSNEEIYPYTCLKIGGNKYTVTSVIILDEFLNHPNYKTLISKYILFKRWLNKEKEFVEREIKKYNDLFDNEKQKFINKNESIHQSCMKLIEQLKSLQKTNEDDQKGNILKNVDTTIFTQNISKSIDILESLVEGKINSDSNKEKINSDINSDSKKESREKNTSTAKDSIVHLKDYLTYLQSKGFVVDGRFLNSTNKIVDSIDKKNLYTRILEMFFKNINFSAFHASSNNSEYDSELIDIMNKKYVRYKEFYDFLLTFFSENSNGTTRVSMNEYLTKLLDSLFLISNDPLPSAKFDKFMDEIGDCFFHIDGEEKGVCNIDINKLYVGPEYFKVRNDESKPMYGCNIFVSLIDGVVHDGNVCEYKNEKLVDDFYRLIDSKYFYINKNVLDKSLYPLIHVTSDNRKGGGKRRLRTLKQKKNSKKMKKTKKSRKVSLTQTKQPQPRH